MYYVHITSQLICNGNLLTGFNIYWDFTNFPWFLLLRKVCTDKIALVSWSMNQKSQLVSCAGKFVACSIRIILSSNKVDFGLSG